LLGTIRSGTYEPVPAMPTRMREAIMGWSGFEEWRANRCARGEGLIRV